MDFMNYLMGKRNMERRLWNESYTREVQMVDDILRPWVRRRIAEGVPVGEMIGHESAALLANVAQWCREYARWRIGSNLPFVEGHPVESWAHVVPQERRPGVLFRSAARRTMIGLSLRYPAWLGQLWPNAPERRPGIPCPDAGEGVLGVGMFAGAEPCGQGDPAESCRFNRLAPLEQANPEVWRIG